MDKIDAEILKLLCKDARTPFKKIAKMLGIGTDTVFRRFKKLQEEGIIQGSIVVLSSKVCGFKGLFGLLIKAAPGANIKEIYERLVNTPPIAIVHFNQGSYDYYAEFLVRDYQEIIDLIYRVRKIPEIDKLFPLIYEAQDWLIPNAFYFEDTVINHAIKDKQ